eukprot:CFRG1766T1
MERAICPTSVVPLLQSRNSLFRSNSNASLPGSHDDFLRREYVSVSREDYGVSIDPMTASLRKCHRFVITPMRFILCILAWQPFMIRWSRFRVREFLNAVYALAILLILLYHYYMDSYLCYIWSIRAECMECRYLVRYIIPNTVHLVMYLGAWYYFRIRRSGFDQIEALIQTVFLQNQVSTNNAVHGDVSQASVLRMLKRDMMFSVFWIILKGGSDMIQNLIVLGLLEPKGMDPVFPTLAPRTVLMITFKCMADVLGNAVHGIIVGTYCMYCGLLGLYVDNLYHRIQHRSYTIIQIIQEITQINRYQREMNGGLGVVLSMVVYLMLFRATNIVFDLMDDTRSYYWNRIGDLIALFSYIAMITMSVVRAARFTRKCAVLPKMTVALHAGGYRDAKARELDSLSLFVSSCPLRAKLFSTPITVSMISRIAYITIVMMMTIGQLGLLNINFSSTLLTSSTYPYPHQPHSCRAPVYEFPFPYPYKLKVP